MNHESWNNILIEVSKKIPAVYYEPFITPLDLVHYDEKKIVLKAPSMAIKKHVEKRYQKYIEEAAFSLFGLKPDIEINTDIDRPVEEFSKQGFQDENFDFNPDYSFNNFVKGKANELAFTALLAALDKPGSINPIFIHGGVASGKTHLLHALGSAYKMKYPNLSVKYISISTFLQEFVSNVQNRNSIEAFRNKYKSYDLLLVDDMQYLNSGAEKTQEEFFNIFNYLYDRRKQIVIASDRYCSELPLNDKLKSRLETGFQAKLEEIDIDTKLSLLKQKASGLDLHLDESSYQFIANNFQTDTRRLIGCLNDLYLYKNTYRLLIISPEQVKEILKNRMQSSSNLEPLNEKIITVVSSHFSIEKRDILSKSRKAEFILPRHLCMYLLFNFANLNKTLIGRMFQTKHTTVINAVNKMKIRLKEEPAFERKIELLQKEIREK